MDNNQSNLNMQNTDFGVRVYSGSVSNNSKKIEIEIYDENHFDIKIEDKRFESLSKQLINKIKDFIRDNLTSLIECSKRETNSYLDNNAYDGGIARNITVKWGRLLINIDGQVNGNIGEFTNDFINHLKELIIKEGNKSTDDVIRESIENVVPIQTKTTPIDNEFEKYCKLYEEKFGKRAYIAEPSGTKEQTINAIKICLEKNEDLLDKLLYPNLEKDMNNGVLYSETRKDLNNDKSIEKDGMIMINDENLKTIIEEVVGNEDQYLNTTVYDVMKKIIDLPTETTTTIADLINYNPNETFVEPLTQGQIRRLVKETCKKLNIELEENRDGFGGLAYYYKFKKVNNDKVKAYMEELINNPVPELSEEDKEFEKYCKLYEERFGKKAYVAEPSGTKEKTIEAIRVCLEKNEDLLDKILYPNFDKDKENGNLY